MHAQLLDGCGDFGVPALLEVAAVNTLNQRCVLRLRAKLLQLGAEIARTPLSNACRTIGQSTLPGDPYRRLSAFRRPRYPLQALCTSVAQMADFRASNFRQALSFFVYRIMARVIVVAALSSRCWRKRCLVNLLS